MNRHYFNAQELAGLPGMPSTVRGVRLKADKESWTKQKKAKGKGFEYYISSLPEQTRAYLAQQSAEEIAQASKGAAKKASTELARTLAVKDSLNASFTAQNRQKTLAKVAHLKGDEQKRAQSKLLVLAMWQAYVKKSNQGKTKATSQFLLLWSEDMLDIPAEERWIRDYINTDLSLTTLYAWGKALESNSSRIWGNYGNRKGTSKIDRQPELREFVIATIYEYPHIYATQLFEAVKVRFENTDIELPSKRSLERWVKAYKDANAQVFTAVTNPDKWKNKYMPAFGTVGVAALNEKWELDSTPADIMLSDGRYNLIGAIDVYSRRAKLLVSKSSTAASVSKLMRDCLLEWGVPDKVKTDNGADYVSLQIKTAFQSLGIEQDISAPFSPWEKPHIERFFRTFSHGLLEIMPGFIGHNVAERSVIEDRKQFSERLFKKGSVIDIDMSSKDLQNFVDQWIDNVYMHNAHKGDGINGKTPFQMVAEWNAPINIIENERALDILLAEVGERVVGKDGIRLDGFTYIAPELGHMATERVSIRKDPIDVGTIHVFQNGEFICVAEDARFVGISRQEIAHQGKQNALKNIAQAKKEIRSMKSRQKVKGLAEEILQAKRQANNVSMMPKKTETYTNDHLQSASEAAQMTTAIQPQSAATKKAEIVAVSTNPQDVYRRWLRLEQKINAGETLEQKDLKWFKSYQQMPEYTDMKEFFEDFGMGLETGSN